MYSRRMLGIDVNTFCTDSSASRRVGASLESAEASTRDASSSNELARHKSRGFVTSIIFDETSRSLETARAHRSSISFLGTVTAEVAAACDPNALVTELNVAEFGRIMGPTNDSRLDKLKLRSDEIAEDALDAVVTADVDRSAWISCKPDLASHSRKASVGFKSLDFLPARAITASRAEADIRAWMRTISSSSKSAKASAPSALLCTNSDIALS
mmetsp:Transcript_8779/g.28859  ORF Transcript_8779/g.28859 Transcript_8779/m.28859 type:complete len:214 (-) Transcript_8779:1862-2503(-)